MLFVRRSPGWTPKFEVQSGRSCGPPWPRFDPTLASSPSAFGGPSRPRFDPLGESARFVWPAAALALTLRLVKSGHCARPATAPFRPPGRGRIRALFAAHCGPGSTPKLSLNRLFLFSGPPRLRFDPKIGVESARIWRPATAPVRRPGWHRIRAPVLRPAAARCDPRLGSNPRCFVLFCFCGPPRPRLDPWVWGRSRTLFCVCAARRGSGSTITLGVEALCCLRVARLGPGSTPGWGRIQAPFRRAAAAPVRPPDWDPFRAPSAARRGPVRPPNWGRARAPFFVLQPSAAPARPPPKKIGSNLHVCCGTLLPRFYPGWARIRI